MYLTLSLALGVAFLLSSLFFLVANRSYRRTVFARLGLRGRSQSHSATPPRSLSPKLDKDSLKADPAGNLAVNFPPSRRAALLDVYDALPADHALRQVERSVVAADAGLLSEKLVPLAVPNHELKGHERTPTGLSIEEIRRLGDFPDYATLSGVPLPQPYENFDLQTADARPYRPFRWAYHQTMSLTKMEPDWWLELTREYKTVLQQRLDLFAEHGPLVLQDLPGSELACKELMEMLLQFLCARYPACFELHPPGHGGSTTHWQFENRLLDTVTTLDGSQHPLVTILNHVPEDYAVMLRDPETGIYHFRAGVICSSLGWSLGSKIGLKLHEIHEPVPDYAEKMRFSMDRYFSKKPTDKAIQRGSWGLEVETPLFMPPGDAHEKYRNEQMDPSLLPLSRVNLRVDWQTLRRLPLSGAVVFNFKGLFTPIEEFRDEPYIPMLLLKVLNEGKENIMKYKNCWHVEHVVKPALQSWVKEQEQSGLVPRNWQEKTLEETPFFPGWDRKWHGPS